MRMDRVEEIFTHVESRILDVRDRASELRAIEGWVSIPPSLPVEYHVLYKEWESSKTQLKFTRWLSKNKNISNQELSAIGELIIKRDTAFKVSCRHNDLLRLSDTPHYNSCLKSWGKQGGQQFYYISDPDVAVVYVPDKSGKFKWRSILRLVLDPTNNLGCALLAFRPYGNFKEEAVWQELNKLLPLYLACGTPGSMGEEKEGAVKLFSRTRHNNELILKTIWSDHLTQVTDKRFVMYGQKWQAK